MASRRTLKAAEAIREVVAMSLLTDLKDPRIERVTITAVEVSGDMRLAKVLFTVFGADPVKERLALAGFRSAAGFLQQKCARRIETRYTPKLTFAIDDGVKNLAAVSEILEREKREREEREAAKISAAGDVADIKEDEADGMDEDTADAKTVDTTVVEDGEADGMDEDTANRETN